MPYFSFHGVNFLQAIPNQSARRALFEHFVRTRAEEERKEKRAAQKAALEGFKQLLEEAKEVWCNCLLLKYSLLLFEFEFWIRHLGDKGLRKVS